MARLILTNNEKKIQKAIKRNIEAGFNDYSLYNNDRVFLCAHKKRVIKKENYIEFTNGDFIAAVGTYIYKEEYGLDALKKIHNDFDGIVENIRTNAIGNYLIAVKKNELVTIFVDKYQVTKTYYYSINGEWFITNSLADIGNVLDDRTINEFAFMQETMAAGVIGTQTIYQNVHQLYGNQIIQISTNDFIVKDIPYNRKRWELEHKSIESIVEEYAEMLKIRFKTVANIFGENIRIHQTGGLDSRTIFAGFMSVGVKPKIMYGVGNSMITNTKQEDLLINKMYAEKFDLDFYQLNWKNDYINGSKNWNALFNRYGFLYSLYGGSLAYFEEYEGKIPDYPYFMECGYFGENLRLREWALKQNKTTFTLDEFIDGYQLGKAYGGNPLTNKLLYPNAENLRDHIKNQFIKYSNIYGIDISNGIGLAQFDEFRHIHSRAPTSLTVNFLNDFAPSIAMLSIYDLHEYPFDIPAKFMANAKFQLMLINKLYPEVLKIPIFSHCRYHKFNSKTFSLTPQYSLSELMVKNLKKMKIDGNLYNMFRLMYRKTSPNKKRTIDESNKR